MIQQWKKGFPAKAENCSN